MRVDKNGMVPVKGYMSKEDAMKVESGEYKFNNGLRNAKGRPSYTKKQPEMWLDTKPDFKTTAENIIVFAQTVCGVIEILDYAMPKIIAGFEWAEKTVPKYFTKKEKVFKQVVEADISPNEEKQTGKAEIIDINEYRKAANH